MQQVVEGQWMNAKFATTRISCWGVLFNLYHCFYVNNDFLIKGISMV